MVDKSKSTGPQNVIPDEGNFGTDLPVTQIDEQQLEREKGMARFSKTKEFKILADYIDSRIEFFKKYLPDGRPLTVENVSKEDWVVANVVIGEFSSILDAYEKANEAVKNATTP